MLKADTVDARSNGMVRCHACELVQLVPYPTAHSDQLVCRRCDTALHCRKPNSLQRTVALLIAATILYLPANILPILLSSRVGQSENDTILSGVVALWVSGAWPLALLVFTVSIVVPTLKLIGLSLLVLSTQRSWKAFLHERAALYRLIELVGRWSMLDVFVLALLVALVQLRNVATVSAGPGALAFATVVVLTMYAARAFDPRLMWDRGQS